MNDTPMSQGYLGFVYGRAGQRTMALGILEKLTAMSRQRYVCPVDFAVVYGGLGDANSVFAWMEKAYQTRATRIHELPGMYFDSVRSDSRYAEMLKRVGLPA